MIRGMPALGVAFLVAASAAEARGFHPIYDFAAADTYSTALLRDAAGNLYGTTWSGGAPTFGTVFVLSPGGVNTTLYTFTGGIGMPGRPLGGVVRDAAGNLYGAATYGGAYNCSTPYGTDCGAIFKLATDGTMSVFHAFQGGDDGAWPQGGLMVDKAGNVFGTTSQGGTGDFCYNGHGCGTVFKITPGGVKTTLYSFQGKYDGAYPGGRLIADKHHNIYGVTAEGGYGSGDFWGLGTVYKLAPNGTETVLYAFQGYDDGATPNSGLALDADGNLYGTLQSGAGSIQQMVFKLAPDGTKTTLHIFGDEPYDGFNPIGEVLVDKKGDLYGTTAEGGKGCHSRGCGTVYRIAHDGTYSKLYMFQGGIAHQPTAGLVQDAQSHLFGSSRGVFNAGPENDGEIYTLNK